MKKTFLSIFLSVVLLASLFSVNVGAYQISGFEIKAEGVLLSSLDTGEVIFSRNADKRFYPASLTKIMTALLVMENAKDLESEIITISKSAIDSLLGTGASMGNLKEGEEITALQALYFLMLPSANDCANAVAEHYGGSIAGFVGMMNKRAEELGMTGTHFANPHGLHDDEHYTTVNDMRILTEQALKKNVFKEVVSTKRYNMPATNKSGERTLVTTIFLQDRYNGASPNHFYKYASGVKTGFTDEAGRCLISTAKKNGQTYLCVLMNCPAKDAAGKNIRIEFDETKKLYEWAFNNFEYKIVVDAETPVAEAKVDLCWDHDYVTMVVEGGLSAILPKEADSSTVQIKPKSEGKVYDAPIKKGQLLDTADVIYAGETLGTVNLIAGDARNANFVLRIARAFKRALTSTAFKIVLIVVVVAIVLFVLSVVMMNRNRKKRRRSRKYKGYSKYN